MNDEQQGGDRAVSKSSNPTNNSGSKQETGLVERLVPRSLGRGVRLPHPVLADGSSILQSSATLDSLADQAACLEARQITGFRNSMAIEFALQNSGLLNPPATSLPTHFSSRLLVDPRAQLYPETAALHQTIFSLHQRNKKANTHQPSSLSEVVLGSDCKPKSVPPTNDVPAKKMETSATAPAPEAKLCVDRKPEPLPSTEDEPAAKITVTASAGSKRPHRRPSQEDYKGLAFPTKLFGMLELAEAEGYSDIISFLPHGNAFMIFRPERFAKEIMPKYFKSNRLTSFQKQLSLYGFVTIKSGRDRGAIFHEYFQRDNQKLVAKIIRRSQPVSSCD